MEGGRTPPSWAPTAGVGGCAAANGAAAADGLNSAFCEASEDPRSWRSS